MRHRPHRRQHLRLRVVQLLRIGGLQRVLILRLGQTAADTDGGRNLQIRVDAGDLLELRAQLLDDLLRALAAQAVLLVLKAKEDATIVGRVGNCGHRRDHIRICTDGARHLLLQYHHVLDRNTLPRQIQEV